MQAPVRSPLPALDERLEELRQKHEQGLLVSIEFLKAQLDLDRDVVEAERTVEPATSRGAWQECRDRAV